MEVPPKLSLCPVTFDKAIGAEAISARDNAPIKVILFDIFCKYSPVGLPGLIHGINPPYCCKFFAYSTVLNCIAV